MDEIEIKGKLAREASFELAKVSTDQKNQLLQVAANLLESNQDKLIAANKTDLHATGEAGLKGALLERLTLDAKKIGAMASGLRQLALLEDPLGEVVWMKRRPNGLLIGQQRVPLGVVGIIYEARPNVTVDVFGLCLKTSNAIMLRGGKEAIHSNKSIVTMLHEAMDQCGIPRNGLQLVENTTRESAQAMMKANKWLDVLIPRGGAGLIQSVVEHSTVPVIETGVGNCHVYVDEFADMEKAIAITVNAKTQRPGVCNAAESLLIHKKVAEQFVPVICARLAEQHVEIRGDAYVISHFPAAKPATEEDWATEYLDLIMSVKIVDSFDEAIKHINHYGTRHSEAIITEHYGNAHRFLNEIDAAAVYVNASTRFTDGYEFGFGAEAGISTQKLHARGPMGLKELTTTKYIVFGNGQIRK